MQKRFYLNSEFELESVLSDLREYFAVSEHEAQVFKVGPSTVLQAKKESTLMNLSGLSSALTVQIAPEGDGQWVEVGIGKWIEKAAVGVVGYAIFWPLLITSALGFYNAHKLSEEVWRIITANVARRRSAYRPPSNQRPA